MITDAHRAYQVIKEKIISLEMPPGSVIQDFALTEELGVGRTPIREALKLLEAENLIFTVPRRGIFVSHVSITDLQQVCEIRIELEGLTARLAAQRADDAELSELAVICDESRLARATSVTERIAEDRKLHNRLAVASHNRFLEAEVQRFYDLSLRLWRLALGRVGADAVRPGSHHEIIAAVQARDAALAESLMGAHILEFQQRIKAAM